MRIFRELGSRDALAAALADLASTYLELGQFSKAEAALLEGLELERALNRPRGIAYKHLGLGNLRLEQGDLAEATVEFNRVIEIAGTDHGYSLLHGALVGLAVVKVQSGDPGPAGLVLDSILASDKSGAETRDQIIAWRRKMDLAQDDGHVAATLGTEEMLVLLRD